MGMHAGMVAGWGEPVRSVRAQLVVGSKPIQAECKTRPN